MPPDARSAVEMLMSWAARVRGGMVGSIWLDWHPDGFRAYLSVD